MWIKVSILFFLIFCCPPAGAEQWSYWIPGNDVKGVAFQGDHVWCATTYSVVRWDRNDGSYVQFSQKDWGSTMTPYRIVSDTRGHIWTGEETIGTVYRFDGKAWTRFTSENSALPKRYMRSMYADRAGNVWFGASQWGIVRFDGSSWRQYAPGDTLASPSGMAEDSGGTLWFGGKNGVWTFDGGDWKQYTTADGLADSTIRTLLIDRNGAKWFATFQGVTRLDGSGWKTFTTADSLAGNQVNVMVEDRSGNLWFGTNSGVSRWDGERMESFRIGDGLLSNRVTGMTMDNENRVWLCHGSGVKGLSRYEKGAWSRFSLAESGIPDELVYSLACDRYGVLWCALLYGAASFDGSSWNMYTLSDGLVSSRINQIIVDSRNRKWFVYGGDYGLTCFDGETWTTYDKWTGLRSDTVYSVGEGNDGSIYACSGGGVMRFDGKNWSYIPHRERLVSSDVENMIEDSRGRMWFATRCGLSCFDGSTWRTWTEGDGLYQNSIIGVAAAADGAIWCSSGGMLTRFDGEQFTPYPPPEGEDTPENRFYVMNISFDTEGTIWTGVRKTIRTSDGGSRAVGIWRFRNGAWELFPIDSGSAGYFSRGVVPDDRGLIWLTSSEGMASWDGTRIREYRVNSLGHVLPVEIVPEDDTLWVTGQSSAAVTYVSQFRDGVWNIFDPGNGQRTGAYFLETDGMGRKWFSTSSVTLWEADSLRVVIPFGEMPYNSSPAFAVDRNGLVWLGTGQKDNGIFSWDGSSWRNYTVADGLVSNRIYRLEFDAAGVLWVAAEGGISRFDGRTWRSWPLGEAIYRIAFGKNGVNWFSSYQSAYRLENEEIEKFSNPAGLSNPSFQSLAVDVNGIVWAGTWAVGVLRFDGREWTQYTTANGLLSDRAGAIGIDKYNRKWIATSAGLCVLDDDGPVAVTNGPPAPFSLHGNYPNPFNPSTAIEFSLPAASRVKLTVYDTTGQIVRELASGMLPAGKHSLAWEGRDDAGRLVSSGLYFARLSVGDRVLVRKMLLLK